MRFTVAGARESPVHRAAFPEPPQLYVAYSSPRYSDAFCLPRARKGKGMGAQPLPHQLPDSPLNTNDPAPKT